MSKTFPSPPNIIKILGFGQPEYKVDEDERV